MTCVLVCLSTSLLSSEPFGSVSKLKSLKHLTNIELDSSSVLFGSFLLQAHFFPLRPTALLFLRSGFDVLFLAWELLTAYRWDGVGTFTSASLSSAVFRSRSLFLSLALSLSPSICVSKNMYSHVHKYTQLIRILINDWMCWQLYNHNIRT